MAMNDKTEKATPKRREDARKKEGMVARSQDLSVAVLLFSSFLLLRVWGPSVFEQFAQTMQTGITSAGHAGSRADLLVTLSEGIVTVMNVLLPFALVLFAVAFLISTAQVRLHFTPKAVQFQGQRINPLKGMKKLLSPKSLVELFKNLLKLILVGAVAYYSVKSGYMQLHEMAGADIGELLFTFMSIVFGMCIKVGAVMLLLGGLDYGYQRYEFEKSIRMTKQEIKEEYKQTEGDPNLRAAIRRRAREISRRRMMQRMKDATVVVVNPTHFAVAMEYRRGMRAPKVVAKGVDFMARRIREAAEEHGVPIVEEPILARAIYSTVELEQEIPPDLYRAVAEILAYVLNLDRKLSRSVA
jgi:flagellar biosynthetic protein FlhB